MSVASRIAPQLPYLRRYARALVGDQEVGDRYVTKMLEALVAEPFQIDQGEDVRVAVYALFTKVWNEQRPLAAERIRSKLVGADRRLDGLTPKPRQAFLLTALEGFEPSEAADILGVGAGELLALLAEAGRQISDQVATNVLVVEDEPIIAMDLESLVEGLGHKVIGNARTRDEAVQMALKDRPGLVLADIQLADGSSGLEAVNDILQSFGVPVIFITAYPEYLLTGQRPEPTFLVTKPFRQDMVKAVIGQALFFEAVATSRAA